MILPELHGSLTCKNFFIYAACDEKYFDEFGVPFINSVKKNTTHELHIHIFNPRQDQLNFCQNKNISVTYEYVPIDLFIEAEAKWKTFKLSDEEQSKYNRIIGAMEKSDDQYVIERLRKTYYACARFIRLTEMSNGKVFAVDIDAIVRADLPILNSHEIFLHFVEKNPRFLAGGIYIPNRTDFLKEYSDKLTIELFNNNLYWGLDQDILKIIVPKYHWGQLPKEYIDWAMKSNSYIWTAKGARKELDIFKTEQQKYM